MKVPDWVSETMPYRGACGLCGGPDARHRVLDAIADAVRAGEDPETVAEDHAFPVSFVERVSREWDPGS